MKLDKIRFAMLIGVLTRNGLHGLSSEELAEIDDIIDIEASAITVDVHHLHTLMALMHEGTSKIEAIKQHRMMTGYGLKESKDIVEKYWPDQTPKLSKQELFYKLIAEKGITGEAYIAVERFIDNLFK